MDLNLQLKLQAYVDGELSEREAREVETLLTSSSESRGLIAELKNTRAALEVFEVDIQLPETREFYWSKIQRAIARVDEVESASRVRVYWWRKLLIPSGTFAALAAVVLLAVNLSHSRHNSTVVTVETVLVDSGAMTYRDQGESMTLVWLSYPAENGFAASVGDDTLR